MNVSVEGELVGQLHVVIAGDPRDQEQIDEHPDSQRDPGDEKGQPAKQPQDQLTDPGTGAAQIETMCAEPAEEDAQQIGNPLRLFVGIIHHLCPRACQHGPFIRHLDLPLA